MFRALFARLTGDPRRGQGLFEAAVAETRPLHWFTEGAVPDTVDGRFALLATVVALEIVRLEQLGDEGRAASAALTERFVDTLDVELREMGLGDPTLGKQVRKLVGALGAKVERWRGIIEDDGSWGDEARVSLLLPDDAGQNAVDHDEAQLRALWTRLEASSLEDIDAGQIR
jgi:cytochrome b pre-mRNA-processing protein 3